MVSMASLRRSGCEMRHARCALPPASAGLGESPASGEAASKAVLSVLPLCSWTLNVAAAVDFFFPLMWRARNKPAGRDFLWHLPRMQHRLAHEWQGRLQRDISNSLLISELLVLVDFTIDTVTVLWKGCFSSVIPFFSTHTGDSTCWAPWFRCDVCSSQLTEQKGIKKQTHHHSYLWC